MKHIHRFLKRVAISALPLAALMLSTNVAVAKTRRVRPSVNRPRIQRVVRQRSVQRPAKRQRITIKSHRHPVKRRNHMRAQKPRRRYRRKKARKRIRRHRHHRRVRKADRQRKRVRRNRKRNRSRYEIFDNASLRHLKVLKNSTRINRRMPKLRLLMTFPNFYRGGRMPQSLNVDQKGHYAYLGFDSYASDGSKVMKYNLYRRRFSKIGPTFSGGHAQAVGIDRRGNLWFLNRKSNDYSDDHAGPINKGSFVEVSPRTLKPIYRKAFRFGHNYMGDNLIFTRKSGVFNVSRIWVRNHTSKKYRKHMLVLYHTNKLTRKGSRWAQIGALRHTPGDFMIQAASYNPRSKRIYVAANDPTDIISMPIRRIMKRNLRRRDINVAHLPISKQREVEGLSFDKKGYLYLLLNTPGQLLRSRRPVTK